MLPESNYHPISRTTQITVADEIPETPKVLVLRLKNLEETLKGQEDDLKSKRKENVNILGQSILGQSLLLSNSDIGDREFEGLSSTLFRSMTHGENDLDDEEVAFQYLEIQEKLEIVREEQDIVHENIQIVGNHEQEVEEISNLQLFGHHLSNIMARQGTTLLTALVTAGSGVYTGNAIVGLGTAIVVGNELFKMISSYIKEVGANDHLLVIEKALKKIKLNNTLSKNSIVRAEKSQGEVVKKIGEIDVVLDDLKKLLGSVGEKQGGSIQGAIGKLKRCKGELLQQSHELEMSRLYLQKCMDISESQREQLNSLLSAEYKITNEKDLMGVIDGINLAILDIKKHSDEAYNFQNQAMYYLLKAMDRKNELISMHHDLTSAFTEIQVLNLELGKAEEKVDKIKIKKNELKQKVSETNEELEALKKINKEDKVDIKIAQENLKAELSKENFGETSIIYGGAITGGTGATIGMIVGGSTVALGLGAVAFIGLGTLGMRAVHMVRLAMRTNQLERKKMELEALQSAIESDKFDKKGEVKVSAEYGYSQGGYLGTRTLKGAWNAAGYALNYAAGKEVIGEYKSSHAGVVMCMIGNLPILFNFDKSTGPSLTDFLGSNVVKTAYEEYIKYGAISQKDQQDLCELLILELKKGVLMPLMILDLLDKLTEVQIGNEVIAMIRKDSIFMETLREECGSRL